MKVKFLRDYHGKETNEFRQLQDSVLELPDAVAQNMIERKIVVSLEPVKKIEPIEIEEKVIEPVIAKSVKVTKQIEPKKVHKKK